MTSSCARWCCCALLLSPMASSHAQTAEARTAPAAKQSGNWVMTYQEHFEEGTPLLPSVPAWTLDTFQNTDEWADGGSFFRKQGIKPPTAYRIEAPFSTDGWLSVAAPSTSVSASFICSF